jgi:hypothetical protein
MSRFRYHIFSLVCLLACHSLQAQEINAKVTVNAQQVATTIDRKIFQTMQSQLVNFINTKKWTNDVFRQEERIQVNILFNMEGTSDANVYKARLSVQAGRPVYNSSYITPLINYIDADVTFKYIEYQPVEFNENRIVGPDPLASNLTATVAYYIYMVLGFDYGSFSVKGGDQFFQKAMNIVNNAPDGRGIGGWRPFDGLRNRYWLAENMVNNKYGMVHDALFIYYRQGMDLFSENEVDARAQILNALGLLNTFNTEFQNTMIMQTFMQGKSTELIKIFKKATDEEKNRLLELVQKIDISNIGTYKQELK